MNDFHTNLLTHIRAGTPLIMVSSKEINRTLDDIIDKAINEYVKGLDSILDLWVWRITNGWTRYMNVNDMLIADPPADTPNTPDREVPPSEVVDSINDHSDASINILVNFHWVLGPEADYQLRQQFIDNVENWKGNKRRTVILLTPSYEIAPDLENMVQYIPYKLPSRKVLEDTMDAFLDVYSSPDDGEVSMVPYPTDDEKNNILNAGAGLTVGEFEKTVAYSVISDEENRIDSRVIMNEKVKDINKSELLTYWPPNVNSSDVGGMDILKQWNNQRRKALSEEAREYGLPYPKGVLYLGIPGAGKTLSVKSLSADWELPLLRLDLGKTFGPLVGDSERLTREVQDQIEALAPVILWIDEAEKAFGGATGISGDSGTTKRVFGSWLTWLQDRPTDKLIYVAMTVNDISSLPPELMRKGRFDEIWWIDAPDEVAREQIWTIHLRKRNKLTEANQTAIYDLVRDSDGYVGAEIEAAVESAMFEAFYVDEELTPDHLRKAVRDIVPASKMQKAATEEIRKRYMGMVRNASSGNNRLPVPPKAKIKLQFG